MMMEIFLVLVGLATLFTVIAVLLTKDEEHYVEKLFTGMMSIFMWFFAGVGGAVLDIPYRFLFENATDNTYKVVEGYQRLEGFEPVFPWLCIGLGILMLVYVWYTLFKQSMEVTNK